MSEKKAKNGIKKDVEKRKDTHNYTTIDVDHWLQDLCRSEYLLQIVRNNLEDRSKLLSKSSMQHFKTSFISCSR